MQFDHVLGRRRSNEVLLVNNNVEVIEDGVQISGMKPFGLYDADGEV